VQGGFVGVGVKDAEPVQALWTDAQLAHADQSLAAESYVEEVTEQGVRTVAAAAAAA